MEFDEFLPKETNENDFQNSEVTRPSKAKNEKAERISQEQFYDIITGREVSWQAIIYELIQTEQLDPWDINLAVLAQKYLEKIRELEEESFFVSSKVLLAASLLLRIKSEILLNRYLKSLDEVLFGKKEEKKYVAERIEIDENDIPILIPKTPLPRFRPVSLQELMSALGKAISTENRRIRKEIYTRQAEKLSQVDISKTRVNVMDRIRHIYAKIRTALHQKPVEKIAFTELIGKEKEQKLAAFLPLLHLDAQQRVWLEQNKHFDEIYIWLYEIFRQKQEAILKVSSEIDNQKEELESEKENKMTREQKQRIAKINKDFENPLAEMFDLLEKK